MLCQWRRMKPASQAKTVRITSRLVTHRPHVRRASGQGKKFHLHGQHPDSNSTIKRFPVRALTAAQQKKPTNITIESNSKIGWRIFSACFKCWQSYKYKYLCQKSEETTLWYLNVDYLESSASQPEFRTYFPIKVLKTVTAIYLTSIW